MSSQEDDRTGEVSQPSTRRSLLKLAGAAAIGAAGSAALRGLPVKAAGSGNTIDLLPPIRVVDTRNGTGPLSASGSGDYTFGPFPALGGFFSTSYFGMLGNLTATGWNMAGWLSIRANGATLATVSNVNFSGSLSAIANFIITGFGPVAPAPPIVSDGMVTIHVGGPASLHVHVLLDLFAYLGPDQ